MSLRLFLVIVSIGACVTAGAQSAGDKSRELSDVKARIREVRGDVGALASEKNAQIEQLKKLEKEYGEQIHALNDIKLEIRQKEQALQDIKAKSSVMQKDIQALQQGLKGLIKAAYAMGSTQGISAFLGQHDPALSGRMMVYYDYLSQARIEKLQTIQQHLQALQQLEAQSDTETQLLQVALEKKQRETEALQALMDQREKLLAQIEGDYALKHGELARLIRDEHKLETLVTSLQSSQEDERDEDHKRPIPPKQDVDEPKKAPMAPVERRPATQAMFTGKGFAELKGQLPWPVQGAITERFGSRRFETTLDGAVIGAREGADIRAVADGRVVYADWLRGYGLMLIVDHGKGFMSLYAFNQSLYKSVGERIRAGERVASVGRSGGRSQASLYFGIRKQGRPVDPEQWCRKPEKG